MWIGRMKSGFYGLKATQASLILIGFVCIAVIGLAWTKTSLLTSLSPPQIRVLHLSPAGQDSNDKNVSERKSNPEQLEENPSTVQEINLAKTFPSANFKDNISSASVPDDKLDIPPSATEGARAEVSENINSSKVGGDDNVTLGSSLSPETHAAATPAKVEDSKYSTRGDDNVTLGSSLSPETHTAATSPKVEDSKVSTNSAVRKDCNLSKGKWVIDEFRPLYSGFGCKQWLSSMWACRLTQRTDFEYEKLRWQPKDCEMDDFTGPKFLERMQHKTLAFVGDSLGRQQFQSLMCMITGGDNRLDVLDVGKEYGLVKARGAKRPDGWAYRFPSTNTTVLYYWSASLCDLQPIDSSNDVAMHLDRPPWFLQYYIHRFDVLVLNTGHHWNRGKINDNRWIMHVGGVPNTNRKIAEIGGAKNLTVYSTVAWVNSQLPKYPGLKAFYRSISPRHFFNGDWNTGGTCDNTTPLAGGKEVIEEESIDPLAAGAVKGTGVKLLDITALSQLRDEGHISRYSIKATPGMQDCLHWCLPGVPDTWNEILFAQI